jgi:hypothetical protein
MTATTSPSLNAALRTIMMPNLIGLTGAAGAGKDSAAAVLQRAGWRTMAFADALRVECTEAWAIDMRLFADRSSKDKTTPQLKAGACQHANFLHWCAYQGISVYEPRSPRWVMQTWGTYRRSGDPLYWVTMVERWILYQRSTSRARLVITDMRLANEAAMLRRAGAALVRVHRPDLPPLAADTAAHETELHHTLPVDAEIHNDGDIDHLSSEVARVLQLLADQAANLGATHA